MTRARVSLGLCTLAVTLAAWSPQAGRPSGQKAESDLVPGLVGEYYLVGHKMDHLPDFTAMKPTFRRVDPQIDFSSMSGALKVWPDVLLKEYFAVQWLGVVKVPEDGSYSFFLKSDDGSRLYVDGKLLIDNDGKHSTAEISKTASLKGGTHDFRVDYFQNEDLAACQVSWEGGGLKRQVIPASAFWHHKAQEKEMNLKK
jgi:hypothetical protein